MRILIVSYHFHPSSTIGAVRWTGLARGLEGLGWETSVISADLRTGSYGARIIPHRRAGIGSPERLGFARILPERLPELVFKARRQVLGREEFPDSISVPRGRSRLRREISAILAAPDLERRWSLYGLSVARNLRSKWKADIVVSSGPPHSAHLLGAKLASEWGVPWVADLRDPLIFVPDPLTWVGRFSNSFLEQLILRDSSLVLTTSPTLTEDLQHRLGMAGVFTLPNGVMLQELLASRAEPSSSFSISHIGSVLAGRNPAPILNVFLGLRRAAPQDDPLSDSVFRLVGNVTPEHRAPLEKMAAESSLPEALEILDPVPRPHAWSLLRTSGLAVILAQNQHHSIPGKLYEAIAARVPAMVVTEKGSASWGMAEELGAYPVEPLDKARIGQLITAAAAGRLPLPNETVLRSLDYSVKARHLRTLLERVGR